MLNIDPSFSSGKLLQRTPLLSQNNSSLLLQLRTRHIPLNSHLHRIGKYQTPKCPHCPSKQHHSRGALPTGRNAMNSRGNLEGPCKIDS
ncbi:hypothetical protein K439DRAFT_396841 [Ramaria rubella]|nr:hypothetical protein K439DRAFT_396841 [Ramaria rubella]